MYIPYGMQKVFHFSVERQEATMVISPEAGSHATVPSVAILREWVGCNSLHLTQKLLGRVDICGPLG